MDLLRVVLFTHLVGMVGLFGAVTLEGVTLRFLRRATSYEQAREWIGTWRLLPWLGGSSLLMALASGIYMATALGLWAFGWTRIAVPTIVVVAMLGAMLAPHRKRLQAAIGAHTGVLPLELQTQLRAPLDTASWRLRTAVLLGLVFEMTLRTDAGLLTMAPFALAGVIGAAVAWTPGK
jgi:hypothetical protein